MADDNKTPQAETDVKPDDAAKKDEQDESIEDDDPKQEVSAEDATSIHVKVYSPYHVYFNRSAKSISAENDTGPFDILPRHHNFMTLVNSGDVIIRVEDGEDKIIRISRGVMHVRNNKVTLFLDV